MKGLVMLFVTVFTVLSTISTQASEAARRAAVFSKDAVSQITRVLEQTRPIIQRSEQTFVQLKAQQDALREKIRTQKVQLAQVQRTLGNTRNRANTSISEARRKAGEAQRLARSTLEIEKAAKISKSIEDEIKKLETALQLLQEAVNKAEAIAVGLKE